MRIINKDAEALAFVWELSSLEWLECAELVDGLLTVDKPGHQYLTSESLDDVLVKLSYKEFSLA